MTEIEALQLIAENILALKGAIWLVGAELFVVAIAIWTK